MQDIRRQFLLSAARSLENHLKNSDNFSDSFLQELFRTLHTIKGTAQTFGLENAGRLAHQLENLLQAGKDKKISNIEDSRNLLTEGIRALIKILDGEEDAVPTKLVEKIRAIIPVGNEPEIPALNSPAQIPEEIFKQLSEQEKSAVFAAQRNGKNLFGLEIGFDLTNFAVGLKNARESLSRIGEIIATFPGKNPNTPVGFLFLFSTQENERQVEEIIEDYSAKIIFKEIAEKNFENNLQAILSRVVEHGKTVAGNSGKQVEFEVSIEEIKLSGEKLKIIFDALLHLVRNAVDHAVETAERREFKGKHAKARIKIGLNIEENQLILKVEDDGRGIDLEKIREKALEKNLISPETELSEEQLLDLIFLPEFSTAEKLTEISGRGVGLDAVKNAVENAGGRIGIKSRKDAGTTFEISLPKKN
ncbi:MAG TPA: ATP-binding protein [Pyrinomonadaceae bacterium]|nr:ATP-binding protein [Pyrinomonadaceae bacterium]